MGDTVLLCVHGIQGGPERFSEIERALAGRFDVVRLLLPGHGADVRAFRTSGMDAWQACVDEAIDELRREYRRIVYLGIPWEACWALTPVCAAIAWIP